MFAVALWTKSAKRIVLAPRTMGIKPLNTSRESRKTFFAPAQGYSFIRRSIVVSVWRGLIAIRADLYSCPGRLVF